MMSTKMEEQKILAQKKLERELGKPYSASFPSEAHRNEISERLKKNDIPPASLPDRDRFHLWSYRFAMRRIHNYDDSWEVDVTGRPDPWFDETMVRQAETMYARRYRMIKEDGRYRPRKAGDPSVEEISLYEPKTDESIAHVAECAKLARLYMDHGEIRRRAAVRGRTIPEPLPLVPTDRMTAAEIRQARDRLIAEHGL